MVGEIIISRVQVQVQKTKEFWTAANRVDEFLQSQPGYVGFSLWNDVSDGEIFLSVYESTTAACAEQAFKALIESDSLTEFQNPTEGTVVNRWIRVLRSQGPSISTTNPGNYLSGSLRVAEPGQADELAADYEMVFDSLQYIEGFIGSCYGPSHSVPEQFVGLVTWENQEAFQQSVPRGSFYELRVFRRVHASEMNPVLDTL